MSRRTLQASTNGIERAKRALKRLGLTQKDLTIDPCIASWATINGFFNGRAIDHTIFKEICFHLELDWQEIYDRPAPEPASVEVQSVPQPGAETLLSAVQQQAIAAREALSPRILERIPRAVVQEKYLPAIRRGVEGELHRIIPIVGPAGYGKSTILGHIYDELVQSETAWVGLILCSTLSLSPGSISSSSPYSIVIVTLTSPTPANPEPAFLSPLQPALLETSFGQSLCGKTGSIVEVVEQLTAAHGRGVLLIDTLDLVVNRGFVPPFCQLLRQLLTLGTTVVFTCRDHEYNDYLEPTRERLPGLAHAVDRHSVPDFSPTEIRQAAAAFFRKLEARDSEQGAIFAENILKLSADNRSLHDITRNPLLLALLCDLFAAEGQVPADLTVSKLYQRYWQEKVAYSRVDQSHFAPLALEKETLCLVIARCLFEQSQNRLCESVFRDDLGIPFSDSTTTAYNHLLSEGVIEHLPSGKFHFFHQTLLEYAIAYWLTRHSAQSYQTQLLTTLREPDVTSRKTYWLPVLRQLLTIVDSEAEFEALVEQLDTEDAGIFGVVAFAAASRDRPDALLKLLPLALDLGETHQKRLRQALESAPRQIAEESWAILLTLLDLFKNKKIWQVNLHPAFTGWILDILNP